MKKRSIMGGIRFWIFMTIWGFVVPSVYADIYEWTDADGVRHFTNYAPPPEAGIMIKTEEVPHDEEADQARREADQAAQQELSRLEIAEGQQALEGRELEAEQKLAEAEQKADEALREAEKLLNEARESGTDDEMHDYYGYPGYYRGYYPYFYNDRYYYRNDTGSIYFRKRPRLNSYKHHRYRNNEFGHDKGPRRYEFHENIYNRKAANLREDHFRSDSGSRHRRSSIRSPGRDHTGTNHPFSRGGSKSGR